MRFIYTDGTDSDFIELCHSLDNYLNELVDGEENRAEYIPYNQLDDIHNVIIAYDDAIPVIKKLDIRLFQIMVNIKICLIPFNGYEADFLYQHVVNIAGKQAHNMSTNMDYKELPERLNRKVIYESDYVCLYADKVQLPNGYIIEKYHQIHYPHEAISIVVFNENGEVFLIQ